jgi:hypothetical protein
MESTNMQATAGRAGDIRACGPIGDIYAAWKQADAAARTLERQVKETWMRYERGVGAFPSSSLLREAASLRHAAREKLDDVVGLLHAMH